jgi:mono/diheme cytochrome c family protein
MHHHLERAVPLGLLPLVLAAGAGLQQPRPAAPADGDARAHFLEVCAACHGETGDGRGTTQLDRPARSFLDGGFSYGNTEEAIYRSLTYGIPGTPMPAAPDGWSEDRRRALARYVIALGPERKEVDPRDTVMVVADRALIARGHLPPIAKGKPERPRGLLIGLPSGASFEYRTDDVRLLGVRQGEFVERRDWKGRGGDPLKPLGKTTLLASGGDPGPFARSVAGNARRDLAARLRGTWAKGRLAGIVYTLSAGDAPVAQVRESVQNLRASAGAGFLRTFAITGGAQDVALELDVVLAGDGDLRSSADAGGDAITNEVLHYLTPDGLHHYVSVDGPAGAFELLDDRLRVRVPAGQGIELAVGRVTAAVHDEDAMWRLLEEVK